MFRTLSFGLVRLRLTNLGTGELCAMYLLAARMSETLGQRAEEAEIRGDLGVAACDNWGFVDDYHAGSRV